MTTVAEFIRWVNGRYIQKQIVIFETRKKQFRYFKI